MHAATSSDVHVGDLKINVSEMIAEHRSPAIVGVISTSFSLYIWYTIVAVHPTGWFLKNTGPIVSIFPSLW